jgi:hypothetical protein
MNSPTFTTSFIDVYGVEHPAAVCMISSMNRTDSVQFGAEGEGKIVPQVYYLVRFWHSAKTKSQGSRQQEFSDPVSGQNSFYLPNPVGHTNEELLAECQAHFLATYTEAAE